MHIDRVNGRSRPCEVAVVIPVRNEMERLERCLRSVAFSMDAVKDRRRILVVVDDGSSDGSVDLARSTLANRQFPVVIEEVDVGQASQARSAGFAQVERWARRPASTWVLSTDADTVVPADWVSRHLAHADRGALAVAGVVTLADDDDGRRIRRRWSSDYEATFADDGGHPHVHAANLGIRLDVHMGVGGFAPIDRIEDIDLWTRLRAVGVEPVADSSIMVSTSARPIGRVAGGFAAALSRLYGTVPSTPEGTAPA